MQQQPPAARSLSAGNLVKRREIKPGQTGMCLELAVGETQGHIQMDDGLSHGLVQE